MKIGLVLSTSPSYSETFFRNKIAVLRKAGFAVYLFTSGSRGKPDPFLSEIRGYAAKQPKWRRFLSLLVAAARLLYSLNSAVRLYRKNREDGFTGRENAVSLINAAHIIGHRLDWLHFGFASNAILLENLARVMGAKMAVSIRGYDIGIVPVKQPGCYRLLWRRIDRLHYISDDLYRLALADGLPPVVQAVKIEPAVDVSIADGRQDARPMKIERPRFLTVGRLHWKKGYPLMLHALSKLRQEGLDFTYRIVGEGEDLEQLVYLICALGLSGQVELLGRKSHGDTLREMGECDVYLQYSIQEGFCNAVLEAQLLGRLCIVSDAEGLSENVLHGQTGWVVPRNEPSLLKQAIEEVLKKPEAELQSIRSAAANRISSAFSLEVQQRKFIDFYRD